MTGVRTQGRAYALQLLYMAETHGAADEDRAHHFWSRAKPSKRARAFAEELVQAVQSDRPAIDAELEAVMVKWKLSRLSVVVRNVLRLAVAEMRPSVGTPPPVAINEALELTRDFMDEESARFVNSVLDEFRRTLDAPPAAGSGS